MEAASAGYNWALLSSRGFCVGIAAWSLGLGPAETARPHPFASVTGACAGKFSRLPMRERGGLAVDGLLSGLGAEKFSNLEVLGHN